MRKLTTPISAEDIASLTVGDSVLISGIIVTARDAAHKLMVEQRPDFIRKYLKDGVIYHCGPVVKQDEKGEWSFVSSGPTTSSREEPYQSDVIKEYGVRAVIGKGGMGKKTSAALQENCAVYLHAIGGAGSLAAKRVKKVEKVFMLEEFGSPEAFWVIEVKDFPVVVTMDSKGGSLHADVAKKSTEIFESMVFDKC